MIPDTASVYSFSIISVAVPVPVNEIWPITDIPTEIKLY